MVLNLYGFCRLISTFSVMKQIEVVAGVITSIAPDGELLFFATQRGYGDFKDGWEFPGGKMEVGETPEISLARELREELDIEVSVGDFICTVDYDYPNFHLKMHCFYCSIVNGELKLLEHEAAKWLSRAQLHEVDWLPADVLVVNAIENSLKKG